MKMNMDSIQFENKVEVGSVLGALESYLETQKEWDSYDDIIKELVDKLEVMLMSW